ncbi:MAG: DUF3473 domain-containing protein [Longimicrobiales bacterium]
MHHFTVDVEESFHAHAARPWLARSAWDEQPRRAPALVDKILDLMDRESVRGTFFVLGWLAKREPAMVRAIADAGHEVASHGWAHRRVDEVSVDEFRRSVRTTKKLLEDIAGTAVVGYRAPSFSIVPGLEWALDVLLEEGHTYDSSMYPFRLHPRYGYPMALPDPHVIRRPSGDIVEVPPATLEFIGRTLPAAGGAYARFLPASLLRQALTNAQQRAAAATVYVHPWELDRLDGNPYGLPLIPRIRVSWGRRRTRRWMEDVFKRFEFCTVAETVVALEPGTVIESIPVQPTEAAEPEARWSRRTPA